MPSRRSPPAVTAEPRALLQSSTRVAMLIALDGTIVEASPGAVSTLAIPLDRIVGSSLYRRMPLRHESEVPRLIAWLLREGRSEAEAGAHYVGSDGRPVEIRLRFQLVQDAIGAPSHLLAEVVDTAGAPLGRVVDTRPQRSTEAPARPPATAGVPAPTPAVPRPTGRPPEPGPQSGVCLAGLLDAVGDLVVVFDDDGNVTEANRAAADLLGLDRGAAHAVELYAAAALEVLRFEALPAVLAGDPWHGTLGMRSIDGRIVQIHQTLVAGPAQGGWMPWVAILGQDVTEHDLLAGELMARVTRDPLTGLVNRPTILEEIDRRVGRAVANGHQIAVGFLDLDRFKSVNDTHGHSDADHLLKLVAGRIQHALRSSDLAGRIGGDEFVVLVDPVADEAEALEVLDRVARSIGSTPYRLGEAAAVISASVGIALTGTECSAETLLRDADAAMYRAKSRGRDRIEVYDDALRVRTSERARLVEDLEVALDRGQIVVHLQPTYRLQDGALDGVEALARWAHPERGLLGPDAFIEAAEESGLITRLGLAVLHQACRAAVRWAALVEVPPPVHVNVSPRQLKTRNFADLVQGVVERCGLEPGRVVLEITESVLVDEQVLRTGVLDALAQVGFGLAIDDFGSGYSSLAYLQAFPVDILKIDRSFIEPMDRDPAGLTIVAVIVNLAHTLNMRAVAEGVETSQQAALLHDIGCDSGQGYLYTRPLPPEQFERLLVAGRQDPAAGRVDPSPVDLPPVDLPPMGPPPVDPSPVDLSRAGFSPSNVA